MGEGIAWGLGVVYSAFLNSLNPENNYVAYMAHGAVVFSVICSGGIVATPYNTAFACFDCQKPFKREFDLSKEYPLTLTCPNCGGVSHNFGRHFKAPKKTDDTQWKKVKFLFDNGFNFQKIYDQSRGGEHVSYPETMEQAKEFVVKYQTYALNRNT